MFSDLTTLEQYTAVVPAAKVILGAPFFGIEWPTSNGTLAAQATGAATDIADSLVQSGADPQYWDPVTETGWTSFQVGDQWDEAYYEDPLGLFDIAQLAARFGVRGVGIWALGMEDDDVQMIAALDGAAPAGGAGSTGPLSTSSSPPPTSPVIVSATPAPGGPPEISANGPVTTVTSLPPASPSTTSGTSTTSTTSTSTTTTTSTLPPPSDAPTPPITGTFEGTTRTLTPVSTGSVGSLASLGELTGFATTDPAYACLAQGPPLTVYLYEALSGYDVAVATTPTDCTTGEFTFPS
jgi:hypothetical protein